MFKGIKREHLVEKEFENSNIDLNFYFSKQIENITNTKKIYKYYFKKKKLKKYKYYIFFILYYFRFLGIFGILIPSKLYHMKDINLLCQKKRIYISNDITRAKVPECLNAYDIKLYKKLVFFNYQELLILFKLAIKSKLFYMYAHKQYLIFKKELNLINSKNKIFYFEEGGSFITQIFICLKKEFLSVKGFISVPQKINFYFPTLVITNNKQLKNYLESFCKKVKYYDYKNSIFTNNLSEISRHYDIGYVRPLITLYGHDYVHNFDNFIKRICLKYQKSLLVSIHPQEKKINGFSVNKNQFCTIRKNLSDFEFVNSSGILIGDFSSLSVLSNELNKKYYIYSPLMNNPFMDNHFSDLSELDKYLDAHEFR